VLGIRPEHISFVETPGPDALSGTVDVSEMMGSELYLHISADAAAQSGSKDVVMRVATIDLPDHFHGGIPYGTKLSFSFPGALVHLFNKETEENLI
jgi:multiple sugar transport system ATP-binding protein